MYSKILIANDGSAGAAKALSAAIALAKRMRAELHMVSVEELPRFPTSIDEVIEERQEAGHRFDRSTQRARSEAKSKRIKLVVHHVAGHPVPAISELVSQHGFDLLVIGYMGHSALYNRLIGSTTDRLVEIAPCSVLVVK